ncbi:DUF89 family protein [bacterium]|nr:DUF89 family protein [bacterium]
MNKYCRACILRFAEKTPALLGLSKDPDFQRDSKELLSTIDNYDQAKDFHTHYGALIEKYTGSEDVFKEEKGRMNIQAESILPFFEDLLSSSTDPLYDAVRISISGNILDIAQGVERSADTLKDMGSIYEWTAFEQLKKELHSKTNIGIIGDNCGEVIFDSLMERELVKTFPDMKITHYVRSKPMLNDCTMDDLDEYLRTAPVTYEPLLAQTESLLEVSSKHDILLIKGQANFEMLWDQRTEDMYFLLVLKCELVAGILKGKVGQPTLAGGGSGV